MKTTSDITALIEVCAANPDDYTTPLILAEAYDDAGDHDRAAFIRLQVEIESWVNVGPEEAKTAGRILQRYRKGAPVRLSANTPATKLVRETILMEKHPEWRPKCPSLNHSTWLKCFLCQNTGGIGTFRRGLLHSVPVPSLHSVLVHGESRADDMTPVVGDWQRTALAIKLIVEWPTLRSIVPVDREPYDFHRQYPGITHHDYESRPWGFWHCGDGWNTDLAASRSTIPDGIWWNVMKNGIATYPTRELAISALGLATYQFLKSLPA